MASPRVTRTTLSLAEHHREAQDRMVSSRKAIAVSRLFSLFHRSTELALAMHRTNNMTAVPLVQAITRNMTVVLQAQHMTKVMIDAHQVRDTTNNSTTDLVPLIVHHPFKPMITATLLLSHTRII